MLRDISRFLKRVNFEPKSTRHQKVESDRKGTLTSSNFLLVGNFSVQITAICIIHHNTETALVHERLFVGNNVGVTHCFEHVDLI